MRWSCFGRKSLFMAVTSRIVRVAAVQAAPALLDLPPELPRRSEAAQDPEAFVVRGGSAIIPPNGRYLAEPVFHQETVLVPKRTPMQMNPEIE